MDYDDQKQEKRFSICLFESLSAFEKISRDYSEKNYYVGINPEIIYLIQLCDKNLIVGICCRCELSIEGIFID